MPASHAAPPDSRPRISGLRSALGVVVLGVALGVLYLVNTQRLAHFVIASESMEPTLAVGAHVMMVKSDRYHPGELVVLSPPGASESRMVKRLVAVGPATVQTRGGLLYVDGRPSPPPHGDVRPSDVPDATWTLAPGQYFVAGDNRPNSFDSRDFGPLSAAEIHGLARDVTGIHGRLSRLLGGRATSAE